MSRPSRDDRAPEHGSRTAQRWQLLAPLVALAVVPGGAFLAAANIGTGGEVAIGIAVAWWVAASAIIGRTALRRWPDLRRGVRGTLALAAVASVAAVFVLTRDETVDDQIATGVSPAEAAPDARAGAPARGGAAEGDGAAGGSARGDGPSRAGGARRGAGSGRGEATARSAGSVRTGGSPNAGGSPSDGGSTGAGRSPRDGPAPAAGRSPRDAIAPRDRAAEREAPAPDRNVRALAGRFTGASGHSGTGDAAVVELAGGGRVLTFSDFDVDQGAGELRVYLARGEPGSDGDVRDFVDLAPLKGNVGDQQYELPPDLDLGLYSTVVIWCVPFSTRIAQAPLS